jgi:hypothetical protein
MSELSDESVQLATAVKDAVVALRTLVNGNVINLNALDTDEKGNLVEAVNELKSGQVAAVQRANHTGEQAQSTVTNLVTDLAGKSATSHNHAGVYDPAGSAAAAQSAAIQRANHTGTQAISTVTGLQTAIDGKSSTAHTHSNAEVNTSIAASPATSATAMGLGTANTPTFAGLNVTGHVNQTGLGNSTYFGDQAGASDDLTANNNTGVGYQALKATTTGSYNVASGPNSLRYNSTGSFNVANGGGSLYSNTIGSNNVASGNNSLRSNSSGTNNVANGVSSLFSNTIGSNNVASGVNSLLSNLSGTNNVANGYQSGRFIANGTTANATSSNSVYLGADTKALASGDTNEIVIGYAATGIGSNTVTLGNSSIVRTALKGKVGIGTTAPTEKLDVAGNINVAGSGAYIRFNSGNMALKDEGGFKLGFQTYNLTSGTMTTKMVLDTDGNVGIGTTAPSAKLDITTPGTGFNRGMKIGPQSGVDGDGTYIEFTTSAADGYGPQIGAIRTGAGGLGDLIIKTGWSSQSERLRVTNGGNVGIGTSLPVSRTSIQMPSTSGIGIALNLNNPGAYGVGQGSKSVGIRFSRSPNDAGSTGIMADIYAGNSVESTSSNGFLAFATRTGVSEVTTERLRIDSSGNVGIGTDAPSEKLDVVGNIKASGVIKKGVLTVGTLPGSPTAGMSSYVTDSSQTLAAGIGTTLVAGGANFTPVHYNGTNWIIG